MVAPINTTKGSYDRVKQREMLALANGPAGPHHGAETAPAIRIKPERQW
jgi:hypothetical protein